MKALDFGLTLKGLQNDEQDKKWEIIMKVKVIICRGLKGFGLKDFQKR